MTDSRSHFLGDVARILSSPSEKERSMNLLTDIPRPSVERLEQLLGLLRSVLFPGFFGKRGSGRGEMLLYKSGVETEEIYRILLEQIGMGDLFCGEKECQADQSESVARSFVEFLPELKRLILTDVEATAHIDPAVSDYGEIIFSYPILKAMLSYRTAHKLHTLGVPIIPRILTEIAHSETGIDIHPAARIGEYFAIDHGTGVVIGATSIIGKGCTLYQGVTLGARNFKYNEKGLPLDIPRHPILEDNVTVFSNTSILGRVTIGHDTVIGGNLWITYDVSPHSRILQKRAAAQNLEFSDGEGI